jgi:TonB family protein
VEQPKLAFETPGQNGPSEHKGEAKLLPPKASIQDAVRDIARGGGGAGGVVVGNLDQPPDLPESIHLPAAPGRTGSSLELMSDPMGVDFKPYLTQILALVRKNWFAVWPESARLGNRGLVQLQFIIDRTGQVPKLVIATPSGSEALDRAAVAGISASVPFPPLPNQFKGQQIRLQFAFQYNVR